MIRLAILCGCGDVGARRSMWNRCWGIAGAREGIRLFFAGFIRKVLDLISGFLVIRRIFIIGYVVTTWFLCMLTIAHELSYTSNPPIPAASSTFPSTPARSCSFTLPYSSPFFPPTQ